MAIRLRVLVNGVTGVCLVGIAITTSCQGNGTRSEDLEFEAASIRESAKPPMVPSVEYAPDGFYARGATAHFLIRQAFGIFNDELYSGEPSWTQKVYFDVRAKFDATKYSGLTMDQRRVMIQQLLKERFGFVFHRQPRNIPVYALTVAAAGPKLQKSTAVVEQLADTVGSPCSLGNRMAPGHLKFTNCSMDDVARIIITQAQNDLHRTVVDRTGLTGRYDGELTWTPDTGSSAGNQPAESDGPWIMEAIIKELGLQLKPASATFSGIVVDHVNMPSAN
jgi:uncharacterized protein (TIGR03435 family)